MEKARKSATVMSLALLLGSILGAVCSSTLAHAGLGDWDASLEGDLRALNGKFSKAIGHDGRDGHGRYTVYEIVSPSRAVREYVSEEGRIFAVTWHGLNAPDMERLLSGYYKEFQDTMKVTNRAQDRRSTRKFRSPHAIVVRYGHMRDLRGKMLDESLLPQGVSPGDIQ